MGHFHTLWPVMVGGEAGVMAGDQVGLQTDSCDQLDLVSAVLLGKLLPSFIETEYKL